MASVVRLGSHAGGSGLIWECLFFSETAYNYRPIMRKTRLVRTCGRGGGGGSRRGTAAPIVDPVSFYIYSYVQTTTPTHVYTPAPSTPVCLPSHLHYTAAAAAVAGTHTLIKS